MEFGIRPLVRDINSKFIHNAGLHLAAVFQGGQFEKSVKFDQNWVAINTKAECAKLCVGIVFQSTRFVTRCVKILS